MDVDERMNSIADRIFQQNNLIAELSARVAKVETNQEVMKEYFEEYKSLFKSLKSTVEGISDKIKKDEAKREHTASIYNKFVSIPAVFGAFALVWAGVVWIDASIERIEGIEEVSENN